MSKLNRNRPHIPQLVNVIKVKVKINRENLQRTYNCVSDGFIQSIKIWLP